MNLPSRFNRRPVQLDPEPIVDQPRRPADPATDVIGQPGTSRSTDPLTSRARPAHPVIASNTAQWRSSETLAEGEVNPDDVSWSGAPIEPAEEDLDLLAESNRRPGKLTVVLLAGILAAVAFGGGALVQKHYGTSSSSASASGFPGRSLGGQGSGGFPGGQGGFPGAEGGLGTGSASGGSAGGGGTAAAATPAVVGTVVKVSGTTVTVKNFGGKLIKVKVPAGTAISLSSTLKVTGLKKGTTITVVGTSATDGSVTASAVTARK